MPKITSTVPSKLKGQREEILRIATTGSIATAIQGIKIFLDEQFYMNEFASLQPKLWMCRTLQKIPMSYAPWNISAQSNGIWKASKHQAKLHSLHDLFVTKRFENGTLPCHNKSPQILCRMEFFQGIAVPTQLHKTEIGCHTAVDSDKNKINAHNAKKESAQVVDKLCFAIACMQLWSRYSKSLIGATRWRSSWRFFPKGPWHGSSARHSPHAQQSACAPQVLCIQKETGQDLLTQWDSRMRMSAHSEWNSTSFWVYIGGTKVLTVSSQCALATEYP